MENVASIYKTINVVDMNNDNYHSLAEQPYSLLSCDCRSKSAGKVAVELGPVWCDEIFDPCFCQDMLTQANNLHLSHKVIALLQVNAIFI